MATIVDVAKKAGVSISTVSYVLSGARPVSNAVKQLVLKTMEELGYRPHAHARALASKRSRILALLFPQTQRGLGETELEFVTGAVEAARSLGYHLVLWTSEYDDKKELNHLVRQGLVDGMIVMEVHERDERIQILKDTGIPFTMIGRSHETALSQGTATQGTSASLDGSISWADIDFDTTFRDAVTYFSGLDHRVIAFINQSKEVYDAGYGPAIRGEAAFAASCETMGLSGIQRFCSASPVDGYAALCSILEERSDVTAVAVMNDRALAGVLRAAAEHGRRVPDELSVLAVVSSARAAEGFIPALSAFEVPSGELARIAVGQLVGFLDSHSAEVSGVLIPCKLVERGSTGRVPAL